MSTAQRRWISGSAFGCYNDRGNLPNVNGFKFIALMDDGTEQAGVVIRDHVTGLHSTDIAFKSVVGWRADRSDA